MIRIRSVLGFIALCFYLTASYSSPFLDLFHKPYPLSLFKHKWIVVNVWGAWCHPCLSEIQSLNQFQQHHRQSIALFGVNFDNLSRDDLLPLLKEVNIHYPALHYDSLLRLGIHEIPAVPITYVFNEKGQLKKTLYGAQTEQSLTKVMAKLTK